MAEEPICTIADCSKPRANSRGWCWGHYTRWRRHGDPLGGGAAPGTAIRFYTEVVLAYDGEGCLTWPYAVDDHGYGKLSRDGQMCRVPRLVCEVVNGPPPAPDHVAAHSCGNGMRGCCTKRHLSWKTSAENSADMLIHGTDNRGEKHRMVKLTEEEVREIRAIGSTMPQREIADRFGVSRSSIGYIQSRKTWGWLK